MTTQTIGIILNGATGRICSTQHLANALVPIRDEGGLPAGDDRIVPRLMLVGRNAEKLAAVAAKSYGAEWTTDLDTALADPAFTVFFDAAATSQRQSACWKRRIAAGKHIYSEKPVALSVDKGLALLRAMQARGLQARRGRGQARPARPAEAGAARGVGISSAASSASASSSAGGCSTAPRSAVPAAELELPQDGRRRAHPRHVSALALRDREHARPDRGASSRRCRRRRRSGSTSAARATTSTSRTTPRR